jgi:hypothetical protein
VRDGVTVVTDVHLSFTDRMRVLVSGSCTVRSTTATENEVGRTETASVFYVNAPFSK